MCSNHPYLFNCFLIFWSVPHLNVPQALKEQCGLVSQYIWAHGLCRFKKAISRVSSCPLNSYVIAGPWENRYSDLSFFISTTAQISTFFRFLHHRPNILVLFPALSAVIYISIFILFTWFPAQGSLRPSGIFLKHFREQGLTGMWAVDLCVCMCVGVFVRVRHFWVI